MGKSVKTPGEHLKSLLARHKIKRHDLASHLEWSLAMIDELCAGKAPLTIEQAVKLAATFEEKPEYWLALQTKVDLLDFLKDFETPPGKITGLKNDFTKIRKNVPLPSKRSLATKYSQYQFERMRIGDSFVMECAPSDRERIRGAVTSNLHYVNKKLSRKIRIATRILENGIGVWRVE
jgi:addiction module HigA family antidote